MRSATLIERKPEPTGVVVGPLMATPRSRIDSSVRSGSGIALRLVDVDARVLEVPVELDAGGLEHSPGGLGELGPGPVARDEGDSVGQGCPFTESGTELEACHHFRSMFGGSSIQLGRIFGIRIGVDVSWFIVLFLIIWSLSSYYEDVAPGSNAFVLATVSALLFFLSILLHELGHAFVAIRNGIPIEGIDLWMFGGVAKLGRDSQSAGEEFRVAVAGPIVTLVIAAACLGLGRGDLEPGRGARELELR